MSVVLIICTAVLGATILAGLHPAPDKRFEAAGAVVIPPGGDSLEFEQRTRQAASLLRQPSTAALVLQRAQMNGVLDHDGFLVSSDVPAGVVTFRVRAETRDGALRLGDAFGLIALKALERGRSAPSSGALQQVGDFEFDLDQWAGTGPTGGIGQAVLVRDGKYGNGALRVRCERSEGCGASRMLRRRVGIQGPLAMTVWVRARRPSRVRLALGTKNDGIVGPPRRVQSRWRRLELRWQPARSWDRFVLALLTTNLNGADVELDAVTLRNARAHAEPPSEKEERRLFGEKVPFAIPAAVVDSRSGSTLGWGLAGAGAGLLIGLAGAGAARVARRQASEI